MYPTEEEIKERSDQIQSNLEVLYAERASLEREIILLEREKNLLNDIRLFYRLQEAKVEVSTVVQQTYLIDNEYDDDSDEVDDEQD